jgi:hypothetical protein
MSQVLPGSAMPGLTDHDYLNLQRWLTIIWSEHQPVFSLISPVEQWMLHDFFVPSWSLADEELIAFRAKVSSERPGLPAAAGRAAARLNARLEAAQASSPVGVEGKRQVKVYAAVRPSVDTGSLARALLVAAETLDLESRTERPTA